jgi:hypothetical protein
LRPTLNSVAGLAIAPFALAKRLRMQRRELKVDCVGVNAQLLSIDLTSKLTHKNPAQKLSNLHWADLPAGQGMRRMIRTWASLVSMKGKPRHCLPVTCGRSGSRGSLVAVKRRSFACIHEHSCACSHACTTTSFLRSTRISARGHISQSWRFTSLHPPHTTRSPRRPIASSL